MVAIRPSAASAAATASDQVETIERFLRLLHDSEPFEIRALKTPGLGTVSGYFSDPHAAALAVAQKLERSGAKGVYVTLNPVHPAVIARADGRLRDHAEDTTQDVDVQRRRWLLLDFDFARPSGISATDEEVKAAIDRAYQARDELKSQDWAEPIAVASGNGAHLLYRVDLPNDPDARLLVSRVLAGVAARFDGVGVTLDRSVLNAARLTKLVGTMARKGDSTSDRPHRRVRLLSSPDGPVQIISAELLNSIAAPLPARSTRRSQMSERLYSVSAPAPTHIDDLHDWLDERNVVYRERANRDGARVYELERCPWAQHSDAWKAYALQSADGSIAAGCLAEKCQGRGFSAMRDALEPGWRSTDRQARQDAESRATSTGDLRADMDAVQPDQATGSVGATETPGRAPSAAAQLIDLAVADGGVDLWHDRDGNAWATCPVAAHDGVQEHGETYRLMERGFQRWLRTRFYSVAGKSPSPQAMQEALLTLEGIAVNARAQRTVATRLASDPTRGDVIYLDLANDAWQIIRITRYGWKVLTQAEADTLPVRFRRPRGMQPLPMPVRGGSVETLRRFINVRDDASWYLTVAALIASLRPTGPYPVLSVAGEQGAAKTTMARICRALIDPNLAPMRRAPRDERDLMIAATNSWVITLDNLSSLPPWLSDALCVLSTGGGFATRALYENDGEVIFTAQRPVMMTGIEDVATRGDLIDRALLVTLQAIPDNQRKTEAALWREFEAARPGILGALLDVVACALRDLPNVRLEGHPRMADFAEWVTAAESALGWKSGAFMQAYRANRCDANDIALDASPVATAVIALLDDARAAPNAQWSGRATDLLTTLTARVGELVAASPTWPKSARGLSGTLRRLAPNLRSAGISTKHAIEGHGRARMIYLKKVPRPGAPTDDNVESEGAQPSAPSAPSAAATREAGETESIGAAAADGYAVDLQTPGEANRPQEPQPPIDRPRANPGVSDDSHQHADGADGADGSSHHLRLRAQDASPSDLCVDLLTLAASCGWPAMQIAPHLRVTGEHGWRTIARPSGSVADVQRALAALRSHRHSSARSSEALQDH